MRDQNIKIIREAAIEANKSILALEFGCRLKIIDSRFASDKCYPLDKYGDFEYKILVETTGKNQWNVLAPYGIETFNWRDIDRFCEIIGRKVGLADVLLALDRKDIHGDIDFHGNMGILPFKGHCDWNLLKSLEDQDDLTLQFLADLLAHREG